MCVLWVCVSVKTSFVCWCEMCACECLWFVLAGREERIGNAEITKCAGLGIIAALQAPCVMHGNHSHGLQAEKWNQHCACVCVCMRVRVRVCVFKKDWEREQCIQGISEIWSTFAFHNWIFSTYIKLTYLYTRALLLLHDWLSRGHLILSCSCPF